MIIWERFSDQSIKNLICQVFVGFPWQICDFSLPFLKLFLVLIFVKEILSKKTWICDKYRCFFVGRNAPLETLKVHFVVQKNSNICHKFMFSLTRFYDKNQNKEKLQNRKWKLTKSSRKTHKYLTNSVFDRLISKPFSNSRSISSFKFVVDFYLWRVFCTTKRRNDELALQDGLIWPKQ